VKRRFHPRDDEIPAANFDGTGEEEEARIIDPTHRSAAEEGTEVSYLGVRGERATGHARGITLWHVDVTPKAETEGRSRHRPQHPPSPQFRLRVPLPRVAVNIGIESAQALVVKTIDKAARAIEGISVTRKNPLPIPGPLVCFSIWLLPSFSRRVTGNSVPKCAYTAATNIQIVREVAHGLQA